jgi:superfamily II DNA or RNA helicase
VVLPTGAGKTQVAMMAIEQKRRATLVVVPTLDLVRQWYDSLRTSFGMEVGVIGGGEYLLRPLTVTTYDSAYLHMENVGNRFGLVVFDECHHLPGESYSLAARQCLAPFRLGLTATKERADGRDELLDDLVGPVVYKKDIVELSGSYLADYDVQTLTVHLTALERAEYDAERAIYVGFLRKQGIRMGSPKGWGQFILRSSSSREGQRAMQAYRRQKDLSVAAPAKLDLLQTLLADHASDRMLIFTLDNATAYEVSRRFLVPAITHQTKVTERSEILGRLRQGEYNAVVTSRVLNEGVDVPAANVAVVLGGSGSVREHVQRLGRILRPAEGKHALLYEVLSAGTSETNVSDRRRDHEAYR